MLKLIYTESGFYLEQMAVPLEALIAQRVALAVRLGQKLHIEPGQASFLVPDRAEELAHMERCLQVEERDRLTTAEVDRGFVELTVAGTWVAETVMADEGIFFTTFSPSTEHLLYKLWQTSEAQVSFLS